MSLAADHTAEKARMLARQARALFIGRGSRLLHGLILFIVLSLIAHLLTVLLAPRYARLDSASRFIGFGADGKADLISEVGSSHRVIDADPLTVLAVCGFDLTDGPLRVSARTGHVPLALSVHLRGGGVFYAVTDKAAQRGVLEFVVLDRQQYEDRVAADDDGGGARELRVLVPSRQGIVLARALARLPSDRPGAEALVTGMACGVAG